MSNWNVLTDIESKHVWNFLHEKLKFRPRDNGGKLLSLPVPSICYDISKFYNEGFDDELYAGLHDSALFWFKRISKTTRMYALNWQHDCYSFDPSLPFEKDGFGEWLIPVFPNGDYLFFLTSDLSNGILADGINLMLCFWGEELLSAIETNTPAIMTTSKFDSTTKPPKL